MVSVLWLFVCLQTHTDVEKNIKMIKMSRLHPASYSPGGVGSR